VAGQRVRPCSGRHAAGSAPRGVRHRGGRGRDLVIGLTGTAAAAPAAAAVAAGIRRGGCYADFNSASAAQKRQVETALGGPGAMVEMADVAVLAPVGRSGAATPLLVSGPGAMAVAGVFVRWVHR
jgi:hypothetical protein